MKSYLTEIYNTASNFFWYPPDKLLCQHTLKERERMQN